MHRAQSTKHTALSIGVTVKSGWAMIVVLSGQASAPSVRDSYRIDLSDPHIPDARQPYHDGFGTARAAGPELERLVASVRRFGGRSVGDAIRRARAMGKGLQGIGIVVGSLVDPATLGNSHVRIHALEGQLFRGVVVAAARRARMHPTVWRERDLMHTAQGALRMSEGNIRRKLAFLRPPGTGAWRAEHKAAALAAWLVLAHRTGT